MSNSENNGYPVVLGICDVAVLRKSLNGTALTFFGVLNKNSMSSCHRMTEFSEIVCVSLFTKNF